MMNDGKEAKSEIEWLRKTLYTDILYILKKNIHKSSRKLLDIGSGTGEFIKYMTEAKWNTIGIELSEEAVFRSKNLGLTVYNKSLEEFISSNPEFHYAFDAITLLNVLEHVPNAKEFLKYTKNLLKPETGIICIRVPNDFSKFQFYAEKKLNKKLWWVAIPDHINYFDFNSLEMLLNSLGLEIIYSGTDFPMELFLLMGDDYIENQKKGSQCHKKRIDFELSISGELRREFYQDIAKMGLGRDLLVFARNK